MSRAWEYAFIDRGYSLGIKKAAFFQMQLFLKALKDKSLLKAQTIQVLRRQLEDLFYR